MNIYEVAKRAGVSIATVSRVVNNSPNVKEETKAKVQEVMSELKYTPNAIARSLVIKSTRTIGVLTSDVRDSFYANAVYAIEQEFIKLGYNVILCNTGGALSKKKKYINLLLEKKVDGIILVGSVFVEKSGNNHLLETAKKVPIVLLNSYLAGKNIYSVVCDDSYAVSEIVKALVKKGHKRIIYIYDADSFSGMAKLKGFKDEIKKHNQVADADIDAELVINTHQGFMGGYNAIVKAENNNMDFTAVIASEDILAAGAMRRLGETGKRVPGDIAVFGFDNSQISLCTSPQLCTVDNKVEVMAINAVRILYDVLEGKKAASKIIVTPDLVLRGTV